MAVYGVGLVALFEVGGRLARWRAARSVRRQAGDGVSRFVVEADKSRASLRSGRGTQPGVNGHGCSTSESTNRLFDFARDDAQAAVRMPGVLTGGLTALLALGGMLAVPLALPRAFPLGVAQGAYREVLYSRPFFFVFQWQWWEWVGVFAPLAILYGLGRRPLRGTLPQFRTIIGALMPFAAASIAYAMVLGSTHKLDYWTRLQPMRSFHLIYIFLFLFLGGAVGEFVLKQRVWRWLALFLPLGAGMYLLAHAEYPESPQVEWPTGRANGNPWNGNLRNGNPWLEAFFWIRGNTPKDAVFALDPEYVRRDDTHGFRAVAERSALADAVKDAGAVSMFPELAEEWKRQQQAQAGWKQFGVEDFDRLQREYGVGWVVEANSAVAGLVCPYRNAAVSVCRIGPAVQAEAARAREPRSLQQDGVAR
jgi:hypothetical protein